jgi:hypothetical protein
MNKPVTVRTLLGDYPVHATLPTFDDAVTRFSKASWAGRS